MIFKCFTCVTNILFLNVFLFQLSQLFAFFFFVLIFQEHFVQPTLQHNPLSHTSLIQCISPVDWRHGQKRKARLLSRGHVWWMKRVFVRERVRCGGHYKCFLAYPVWLLNRWTRAAGGLISAWLAGAVKQLARVHGGHPQWSPQLYPTRRMK